MAGQPATPPSYEWVDLPVGPQPLPAWLKAARVDWSEGYVNAPDLRLLTTDRPDEWEGKRWQRHGDSLYAAVSEDGRGAFLSAGGEPQLVWMREKLPFALPIKHPNPFMGSNFWGLKRVWATPQSEGFAGRHFEVVMQNGTPLVLRGPWFGAALPGYVQVSYHIAGSRPYRRDGGRWNTLGYFGLFITEGLWLKALARFAPECRCARVTRYGRSSLEPVRGDWDAPKHWIVERERAARQTVKAA